MKISDMEAQLRIMATDKQKKLGPSYSCKHCNGTGRIGYNDGVPIPCGCTGTSLREVK